MKSIELYTYGSVLKRDGLPLHAMLSGDVRAVCGASGISFAVIEKYSRNESGEYFQIRDSIITKTQNPIGCNKCLEKLFRRIDEYHKPIRTGVGEYRYMGHWITDQREWPNLPPWVTIADTQNAEHHPHWSFAGAKAYCKANRVDGPETQVSDYI